MSSSSTAVGPADRVQSRDAGTQTSDENEEGHSYEDKDEQSLLRKQRGQGLFGTPELVHRSLGTVTLMPLPIQEGLELISHLVSERLEQDAKDRQKGRELQSPSHFCRDALVRKFGTHVEAKRQKDRLMAFASATKNDDNKGHFFFWRGRVTFGALILDFFEIDDDNPFPPAVPETFLEILSLIYGGMSTQMIYEAYAAGEPTVDTARFQKSVKLAFHNLHSRDPSALANPEAVKTVVYLLARVPKHLVEQPDGTSAVHVPLELALSEVVNFCKMKGLWQSGPSFETQLEAASFIQNWYRNHLEFMRAEKHRREQTVAYKFQAFDEQENEDRDGGFHWSGFSVMIRIGFSLDISKREISEWYNAWNRHVDVRIHEFYQKREEENVRRRQATTIDSIIRDAELAEAGLKVPVRPEELPRDPSREELRSLRMEVFIKISTRFLKRHGFKLPPALSEMGKAMLRFKELKKVKIGDPKANTSKGLDAASRIKRQTGERKERREGRNAQRSTRLRGLVASKSAAVMPVAGSDIGSAANDGNGETRIASAKTHAAP